MIYLDHAATTRPHDDVLAAMAPFHSSRFYNPSALYADGTSKAIEHARNQVAALFDAAAENIVFTAGGSEADTLAVVGAIAAGDGAHVVTSTIEHPAVRNACRALERQGVAVSWVSPEADGRVDPRAIEAAIRAETALISVMHANNETGVVQPIEEIGQLADDHGVTFHSDTVQSVGKIPTAADTLGLDLASLSAHKLYGPKGVGALYVREEVDLEPVVHGGGQERGLRGGTEHVAGVVGLGRAAELALADRTERAERLQRLRARLVDEVLDRTEARLIGHPEHRLPGYATFGFEGHTGAELVECLADRGIACSSGSACHAGTIEPSRVLVEMGVPHELATGALRFTSGRETTRAEVETAASTVADIVSAPP